MHDYFTKTVQKMWKYRIVKIIIELGIYRNRNIGLIEKEQKDVVVREKEIYAETAWMNKREVLKSY